MRSRSPLSEDRGTAVIEFALVLPFMSMLMAGVLSYGIYFWRANALQEVAAGAARAAIAGVSQAERRRFVDEALDAQIPQLIGLAASDVARTVADTGTTLTLDLRYDGSRDVMMGAGLIPLPSAVIHRRAVIRLAGL